MLSRWAERSGLFSVLAPRKENDNSSQKKGNAVVGEEEEVVANGSFFKRKKKKKSYPIEIDKEKQEEGKNKIPGSSCLPSTTATNKDSVTTKIEIKAGADDGKEENKKKRKNTEQDHRESLLEGQKMRETQALTRNDFCKYQRARYLHKATQTWYNEAYVVGVHHDDGVDQPYYTIVYHPHPDEDPVEKQTTRDRLTHSAWDEQKTWDILSKQLHTIPT